MSTEIELAERHRQENADLIEMGYTVHDKEYWIESDRQKAEWLALRSPLVTMTDDGEVIVQAERRCRDCDVELPKQVGRGRPSVRCPACRGIETEGELINA